MIESLHFSEMLVHAYKIAGCYNPKDNIMAIKFVINVGLVCYCFQCFQVYNDTSLL
jgi:hypothetical protein